MTDFKKLLNISFDSEFFLACGMKPLCVGERYISMVLLRAPVSESTPEPEEMLLLIIKVLRFFYNLLHGFQRLLSHLQSEEEL